MKADEVASLVNRLRIFPRILVLGAVIYCGFYIWGVTDWYMALAVRTVQESAFVGSVVTLIIGILKFMIDKYMSTGRND